MLKVVSVIGTRPEALKMAPVVKALARYPGLVANQTILTGQHRELVDEVLELFEIEPGFDLDVMTDGQTPEQVAGAVFGRMGGVLRQEKPDWVLVQGDTTTAMAAAISAFYARVKVGHVEAGLRTDDKWSPFPEELNRRVVSITADFHFAPTETARQNLIREGVKPGNILVTGNTGIDALKHILELPSADKQVQDALPDDRRVRVVLLTTHRRENFGEGIRNICTAVREICNRYKDALRVVYPVHPNPNVFEPVRELLSDVSQVALLPAVKYPSLAHLMARSYLVMTDSGGIQEEAPALGKPVLVLREKTERPEGIVAGTARLVGTDPSTIMRAFAELWEDEVAYGRMAQAVKLYGDGKAAKRIVCALLGKSIEEFTTFSLQHC